MIVAMPNADKVMLAVKLAVAEKHMILALGSLIDAVLLTILTKIRRSHYLLKYLLNDEYCI